MIITLTEQELNVILLRLKGIDTTKKRELFSVIEKLERINNNYRIIQFHENLKEEYPALAVGEDD